MSSLFTIASPLSIALVAFMAWRWVDSNVLSLGIKDGRTTVVNQALLLDKIRAFELATIKHTYQSNARIDASKDFNAGVTEVGLPSWLAGQKMSLYGKVTVTAGADLSQVTKEDLRIARRGDDVRVTIVLPAPQVLSAEVMPDTLDIETSQGVLTRLRSRIGFNEKDLKDDALDRLIVVARDGALKNGLLEGAQRELTWRMQGFLNSLAATGSERVTYVVETRPPANS
jgi:hypothetical protein